MPPLAAATVTKPLPELPIVELTGVEDPETRAPQSGVKDLPVLARGTHGRRGVGIAFEVSPPVLNGFLTSLNTVAHKLVGSLARAFLLTMQLAGCDIPSFPDASLRHEWERPRAVLPLH